MNDKAPKERSPSFPFIPLGAALQRLQAFDQTFGRHPAPADKAGLAWGMKEKSSQAAQTLAALKSFNLVDYDGSSTERRASLTDDARTYLRAQQEHIKQDVVKRCALKPKQFQKFWAIWGSDRPPDAVCLDDLILKHAFTDSAAHTFLKVYDDTISFAGLTTSDTLIGPTDDDDGAPLRIRAEVGDLVQVEIDGVLRLPKPARVRAIQPGEGIDWVFVEGSETGIPMDQILVERKAEAKPQQERSALKPPTLPEPKNDQQNEVAPGMKEEKNSLDEGEAVLILPDNLSAASVADLEYWLQGILRKARRRAGVPDQQPN